VADEDYLDVLCAVKDLPFHMGKKALVAVLHGDSDNDTVSRNHLEREPCYGCLSGYGKDEIEGMFSRLFTNGLLARERPRGKFFQVITITQKGVEEIKNPTLNDQQFSAGFISSPITKEQEQLFQAFDFILTKYNDQQKQAIVSKNAHILCVAGAGSGKTTVLTKRIEFLVRYCGVPREKILAVTFTRKARQEMQERLGNLVQVETFNSFAERQLQQHGNLLYGKPVRVIHYRDRIRLLHHALKKLNLDMAQAIAMYFTPRQRSGQPKEKLANIFMNDCFGIMDYYANNNQEMEDFSRHSLAAKMVYNICRSIKQEMRELGLRDYADQLTDILTLFTKHKQHIPQYDHILVDEYQDVNQIQRDLIHTLRPKNLFVVGDPRQSIFGWRGSKLQCIIDFERDHKDTEVIVLTTNYRSGRPIVQLVNESIKRLQLPDLDAHQPDADVRLSTFKKDTDELDFVATKILATQTPREEIFVLTRTNKQAQLVSELFTARQIAHVVRSEEAIRLREANEGEVTVSTVHAIKGLEADCVFVSFCNSQSYPCIASDHPVLDMVKQDTYDREEEELRLLYVAMSRARKELHVTFAGTPSRFLTPSVKRLLGAAYDGSLTGFKSNSAQFQRLREWRTTISRTAGIPPYMVLSDKTLLELCHRLPTDMPDLQQVPGIGPAKAQKYGEQLLTLLHG